MDGVKECFVWIYKSVFLDVEKAAPYFIVVGAAYLLLFLFVLSVVKWTARRRKRIRETIIPKEVFFTVPDRENRYLQQRLANELDVSRWSKSEQKEKLIIPFACAQNLLARVVVAPLTAAERLEVDLLRAKLEEYFSQNGFTAREVRELNDCFARLLKLSAKHAV